MKSTRLALLTVFTALTAAPAIAASVTMLQFGSFETRTEAEKRLSDISAKHAALLSKLGTTIREVKLPPDNLTVYRTQAGPVESRALAQTICASLGSKGDECYIVQTAMAAAPPSTSVSSVPAVSPQVSDVKSHVNLDPAPSVPPAPDLTSKLSTLSEVPVRDDSNLNILESGHAPQAEGEAVPPAPKLSAEMKAALDQAVSEQAASEASIQNTMVKVSPKAKPSFWSRLNPFSSDTSEPSPTSESVSLLQANAAPVEAVAASAVETPVVEPVIGAAPQVAATASVATPSPVLSPSPIVAPVIIAPAPVILQADPLQLPPPPAPLNARDRDALIAARDIQSSAAPIQTGSLTLADSAPSPAAGSVQVEEAKRVPVTQATLAPQSVAAPVAVALVAPMQPAVPLNPSATDGLKTVWAQVGPFSDGDAALAFWANYRQAHPDFPVVRVRVTSPLQQQVRGSSQAWLRVGPVMRAGFVKNLCAGLPMQTTLKCGTVSDMGSSSRTAPGILSGSRYYR